jgi:hypothetical protein
VRQTPSASFSRMGLFRDPRVRAVQRITERPPEPTCDKALTKTRRKPDENLKGRRRLGVASVSGGASPPAPFKDPGTPGNTRNCPVSPSRQWRDRRERVSEETNPTAILRVGRLRRLGGDYLHSR